MLVKIRKGVFETNSSSCHSIVMCKNKNAVDVQKVLEKDKVLNKNDNTIEISMGALCCSDLIVQSCLEKIVLIIAFLAYEKDLDSAEAVELWFDDRENDDYRVVLLKQVLKDALGVDFEIIVNDFNYYLDFKDVGNTINAIFDGGYDRVSEFLFDDENVYYKFHDSNYDEYEDLLSNDVDYYYL